MFDRPQLSAARTIFTVLLWGIVTELAIVALALLTERSLPVLLHIGLLYLGSYGPLLVAIARERAPDKRSS